MSLSTITHDLSLHFEAVNLVPSHHNNTHAIGTSSRQTTPDLTKASANPILEKLSGDSLAAKVDHRNPDMAGSSSRWGGLSGSGSAESLSSCLNNSKPTSSCGLHITARVNNNNNHNHHNHNNNNNNSSSERIKASETCSLNSLGANKNSKTRITRDENFRKRALFNDLSYGTVPGNVHLCSNEVIEKLAEKYGVANLIRQISSDLAERDAEVNILRKQHEDRERELKKMLMECDISIMDVENRLMNLKTTSIHNPDSVIDEMLNEAMETNSISGRETGFNENDQSDQLMSIAKPRKNPANDRQRTTGVRKSSWLGYLWKSSSNDSTDKDRTINDGFPTDHSHLSNEEDRLLKEHEIRGYTGSQDASIVNDTKQVVPDTTVTSNNNWINSDWIPQSIIDHVPQQVQLAVTSHKTSGKDGGPVELDSIVPPGTQPPTLLQTWNDHYGAKAGYLTDRFGFIYNKHKMSNNSAGLAQRSDKDFDEQSLLLQPNLKGESSGIKETHDTSSDDIQSKGRHNHLWESDASSFDSEISSAALTEPFYETSSGKSAATTPTPTSTTPTMITTTSSTAAGMVKFTRRAPGLSRRVSIKYKHNGSTTSFNSLSGDTGCRITLHPSEASMDGVLPQVSNVLVAGRVSSSSTAEHPGSMDFLSGGGSDINGDNHDYGDYNHYNHNHNSNTNPSLVNKLDAPHIRPPGLHSDTTTTTTTSGDNSVKILLTQLTDIHDNNQRSQRVKWDDFLRKLDNAVASTNTSHGGYNRNNIDQVPEIIVNGELLGISGVGLITSKHRGGKARWNEYKALVLQGIPVVYRQKIWNECSGARTLKIPGVYESLIDESSAESQDGNEDDAINQIDLDLYRTMPGNVFFGGKGPGVPKLRRVLIAYSRHNKEIGYCQGMNVIAAILLLTYSSEEDAFWSLVSLIENILPSGYFNAPLLTSRSDQRVLNIYFAKILPKLYEHLNYIGVDIEAITFDWFLSCFTSTLPAEILFRIWDVFLCVEGEVYLFRIALSLFKIFEKNLLEIHSSAEVYNFMKNLVNQSINIEVLIKNADGLSQQVKDTDVKRLRKEEILKLQAEIR